MLGILFTNVTVIIYLFKTNQTSNLSFGKILHINFSDVLVALVALLIFIFGTVIKTNSRLLVIASSFFNSLLTQIFVQKIGLLGVNRFIRIKYYTKHWEILTLFCFIFTHILICWLAVLNSFLIVFGLLYETTVFEYSSCYVIFCWSFWWWFSRWKGSPQRKHYWSYLKVTISYKNSYLGSTANTTLPGLCHNTRPNTGYI